MEAGDVCGFRLGWGVFYCLINLLSPPPGASECYPPSSRGEAIASFISDTYRYSRGKLLGELVSHSIVLPPWPPLPPSYRYTPPAIRIPPSSFAARSSTSFRCSEEGRRW